MPKPFLRTHAERMQDVVEQTLIETTAALTDGTGSNRYPAQLAIHDGFITIQYNNQRRKYTMAEIAVLPRMHDSKIARVRLPNRAVVEFQNNEVLRAIHLQQRQASGIHQVAVKLERSWRGTLVILVLLGICAFSLFYYGVPVAAKLIAYQLPVQVDQQLGADTLRVLDKFAFEPSELNTDIQQRVLSRFQSLTREHDATYNLTLLFRKGNQMGANAFALPSGIIVLTDEMVALAKSDDELVAVLGHEIGHVVHRHSLQTLLQDASTNILFAALVGDNSVFSNLATALPKVIIHSNFSRDFEEEADRYALRFLVDKQISPGVFADILSRMTDGKESDGDTTDFFDTHPATEKRIQMFRKAAEEMD